MKPRILLTACGLAVALVGCSDPRDTPGHLEPGNSIRVAQQALGSSSSGGSDGATIGSLPYVDFRAANIPVMVDGVIDYVYAFSVESPDGEAERDETWVKIKVQEQSFMKSHRNNMKSLLNDAQSVPRTGMIPNSARLKKPASGNDSLPMPLVGQTQQQQTRLTIAELDASGNPRVLGSTNIPAAGTNAPTPTGNPTSSTQVQEMLQYFNAQQQARANATQNGGSTTTPNPAPTGGTP